MPPIDPADLHDLLEFVLEHAPLYARLNVEFFSSRVYEDINPEWLQFMRDLSYKQLNSLPTDFEQYPDCPPSLKHFFTTARHLSLLDKYCAEKFGSNPKENGTKANGTMMRKVKRKKAHELEALSQLLMGECAEEDIDRVVDVGCGLGHLGRVLRNDSRRRMDYVGIEANPEFCHSARKIGDGKGGNVENVVFAADTLPQCRRILCSPGRKSALVSLHGCGDLQRVILREFVSLAKGGEREGATPLLVTIGCCYHKLQDWTDSGIERWVLSSQVWEQFRRSCGPGATFPIPGLRLACQAKLTRWMAFSDSEHQMHRQTFANRALVECVRVAKDSRGGAMERKEFAGNGRDVRKLNRNLDMENTEQFRAEVLRRSGVTSADEHLVERELDQAIAEHGRAIDFIEPFTALQFALQAPLESLVLLDRLAYLRECGMEARLVELFDPLISPRNIAIVAKPKSPNPNENSGDS